MKTAKQKLSKGRCNLPGCWIWNLPRKRPMDAIFVPPLGGETNTTVDDSDYSIDGDVHADTVVVDEDVFHDCQEYDYSKLDEYYELLGQTKSFDPNDELVIQLQKEQDLRYMLSCLTDAELEVAARTSYLYLKSPHKSKYSQEKHAGSMARRYLASKKKAPLALKCMKGTLRFRKKSNIDSLREAFYSVDRSVKKLSGTAGRAYLVQDRLSQAVSSKRSYVMGYDKQGHATIVFVPRCYCGQDKEWIMKEMMYTMERALACSEARFHKGVSKECSEKSYTVARINAVVDLTDFDIFRHTPSLATGKDLLLTLRKHYVDCVEKIFVLNAPPGFPLLWNLFSNFVGTSTRHKIRFVSRNDELLQESYRSSEVVDWMMEGGRQDGDVDIDEYLFDTPFDQAFREHELEHKWIFDLVGNKNE